jgi:sialic acid synthase SpsE
MKADMFNEKNIAHTYIIAEAGLNHNGSVEIAKQLIDLAIKAGADAVKFQKRTVEKLAVKATLDAPDDRFPEFGTTYREIREHLEFNMSQYQEIKKYAEGKGLDFLCTAFDTEAADFLEELGIKIYKLASHSATNIELLEYLAKTGKKSILSTGMADIDEIETAVQIFEKYKTPLLLLHCVSSYPTPLDECNLNMINVLKENFNLPVGYSGHELGYLPTLTAVSMGAVAIERHYTLDNNMIGFDHKMSLSSEDFIEMVSSIRSIEKIKGTGRKEVSETEWITRRKYHVSMTSSQDIPAGTELIKGMVVYRNPGTGIPAKDAHKILGKRATQNILADELLSFDMFK